MLAFLVAAFALWRSRVAVRRIERMSESYWELRYESGQLKARMARLELQAGLREPLLDPAAAEPVAKATFVPLSSLRK